MAQWHTLQSARAEWIDAPQAAVDADDLDGDAILTSLLDVAQSAVLAYAPDVAGATFPSDPVEVVGDFTATFTRTGNAVTLVIAAGIVSDSVTIPDAFIPSADLEMWDGTGTISAQLTAADDQLTVTSSVADGALTVWYPTAADPIAEVPAAYRAAQLMQARNVWNASRVSPSAGDFDSGQYGLVTYPLDWQIRQLLRPKRGLPVIS